MTDIYIVIEVGYEGIEEIYRGFLNPYDAVEFVKKTKQDILNDIEENGRDDFDKEWMLKRVQRLCVMKGDENHEFECVCKDLGVDKILGIEGELILY